MLISCVAAIMLRTTTGPHCAGLEPQYFLFGTRVICEVVLYCCSWYGPDPAPADAAELSHCSALSAFAAFAASVPPCFFTSFEFTTPSDVFARIAGSAVFGTFERRTTVYLPREDGVIPSSRNEGFPFRLMSRRNENKRSAAVSVLPSAEFSVVFVLQV